MKMRMKMEKGRRKWGVVRTVPGEELGDLGDEGDGLAQGLADVGHGSLAVEDKAHARSQVEQHGAFVGAMRHRKVEPAGQPHINTTQ